MLMPAPLLAARPTRKVSQLLCVANAAANSGARRRNGPVHQAGQARLNDLQQEEPFLLRLFVFAEFGEGDAFGGVRMVGSSSARSPSNCRMPVSVARRPATFVKTFGFQFHAFGGFLNGFQAERTHEPTERRFTNSAHVLPPDERHVVAETAFVKVPAGGGDGSPLRDA